LNSEPLCKHHNGSIYVSFKFSDRNQEMVFPEYWSKIRIIFLEKITKNMHFFAELISVTDDEKTPFLLDNIETSK